MSGFRVEAAIRALFEALRAEGVSPIEEGHAGMTGLSPEQRLLLAGLEYVSSRGEASAREAASLSETPLPDAALPEGPEGARADAPEHRQEACRGPWPDCHGPRRPLSRHGACAACAGGHRVCGVHRECTGSRGFRAPPGDRSCPAPPLCGQPPRHPHDPSVRGTGLRHPDDQRSLGRYRGSVPPW